MSLRRGLIVIQKPGMTVGIIEQPDVTCKAYIDVPWCNEPVFRTHRFTFDFYDRVVRVDTIVLDSSKRAMPSSEIVGMRACGKTDLSGYGRSGEANLALVASCRHIRESKTPIQGLMAHSEFWASLEDYTWLEVSLFARGLKYHDELLNRANETLETSVSRLGRSLDIGLMQSFFGLPRNIRCQGYGDLGAECAIEEATSHQARLARKSGGNRQVCAVSWWTRQASVGRIGFILLAV